MKNYKPFVRNSFRVMLVTLLAISLWRCADQQPENAGPRSVQFAVHTTAPSKGANGRAMDAYLPAGTELLLSVEKSNGESALDHERVELLKLGDGYVSGPISLNPGTYSVTDFMLVLGDSVLYLTPQAGSPMAGQVANPMPYSFTVSEDALLTLDAEVVRVGGESPAEFGYTAFNIGINDTGGPSFQVAAFAADDDGLRLTTADALILNGLDTLDHITLDPKTNTWPFTLDTTATYTLVVTHPGFMRYSRPFNYTDLKEELDGKPLKVTLTPAVTFVFPNTNFFYGDLFCGPDEELLGRMYIDFGDNTGLHDWIIGGKFYPGGFGYTYAQVGTYFASINGDLDMFLSFGIRTDVTEVDLTALHHVRTLGFDHKPSLRAIRVSRISPITGLSVNDAPSLSSTALSTVIDDLYASVIYNNTHGGSFNYTNNAAPSAAAQAQLLDLAINYGWTITH